MTGILYDTDMTWRMMHSMNHYMLLHRNNNNNNNNSNSCVHTNTIVVVVVVVLGDVIQAAAPNTPRCYLLGKQTSHSDQVSTSKSV